MDDNLHRESLLFRYTGALERGDMTTLLDILTLAADDPILGQMLEETDAAYAEETDSFVTIHRKHAPTPTPNTVDVPLIPSTTTIPANNVVRYPFMRGPRLVVVAATFIAMVAFISLIIATNIGIMEQSLSDVSALTNYPVITAATAPQLQAIDTVGRGAVYDVAWSPSGDTLALATATGLYQINVQNRVESRLSANTMPVDTLAYLDDGRMLGISGGDLLAWDLTAGTGDTLVDNGNFYRDLHVINVDPLTVITRRCADALCETSDVLQVAPTATEVVTAIQSGPIVATAYTNGLLAIGTDATITLWDVSEQPVQIRHTFEIAGGDGLKDLQIADNTLAAMVAQSQLIADTRSNGGVMVPADMIVQWDVISGEVLNTTDVLTPSATTFAVDAAGQPVYYQAARNFRTNQPQLTINTVTDAAVPGNANRRDALTVQQVAVSDNFIATVLAEGGVQIWDAEEAELLTALDQFRRQITQLAFSPVDTLVAFGDTGTLDVWDYLADDRLWSAAFPDDGASRFEAVDTDNGFAFAADGQLIYADDSINRASLAYWTRDAGQSAEELGLRSLSTADLITTDSNGSVLAYFFEDAQLVRQNPVDGIFETVVLAANPGLDGIFSPDGALFAQRGCIEVSEAGCAAAGVSLFDTVDGNLIGSFALPFDFTLPSGDLALSREARTGRLLLAASGCSDAACTGFHNGVWDITDLLSGDAATPQHIALFDGYQDIAFNADGALLASIQADRLWVVNIADERVLLDHQLAAPADALAFSPDGSILGVSGDGVVYLLGVPVE